MTIETTAGAAISAATTIAFLREFKELARLVPLKAYADLQQRDGLVDAVQFAMDQAIEREEEEGSD